LKRLAFTLFALLWSAPAWAQKGLFFADGNPVVFREEEADRRFKKTRIYKALNEGTNDPNCVQLLGGLLTALGEAAPFLHRRDANFSVDPYVLGAVQSQLSVNGFPAGNYLNAMVRRVLIDKKMPDGWMVTAERINPVVRIIDLAKLKYMNEGTKPIDSFYFTLGALRDRWDLEVLKANSLVRTDVAEEFRDSYLDRDVAWGGATLIDFKLEEALPETPAPGKKKKYVPDHMIAYLEWTPPAPSSEKMVVFAHTPGAEKPIRITAELHPRQYLQLASVPKGKRLLVKGRFWEMNKAISAIEMRDVLLFEDRDWSRGILLADPNAVAACPLLVNELTGVAPIQPGGFGHR
jgi:hypothetical protein